MPVNRLRKSGDRLTVVVCPQRVYERLQSERDESYERLCREYADLLA